MGKLLSIKTAFVAAALALIALTGTAQAQSSSTLDRVINSKTLRCGIQLDYPPAGFRTPQNEPEGYDVAYCKDMAKALGATAQIVETPSAERIPSLVSNRIDVLIASTSITPQRALSVAFSQPYVSFINVAMTHKDTGVQKFDDLKGRTIGGVTGSTTEQELRAIFNKWNDPKGKFISYGSESEAFLALNQRKIDGLIVSAGTAGALVKSGQFPALQIKGEAPSPADLVGIAVRKSDADFLRWINVFVWNQVRTGRYQELYRTYFGEGQAPALNVPGVDY
ncbi:ABC transporter substrate-binding protein [Bordetella petrii]|uniref:ABC transporter, substrate binding protein n=1 Tax=Bordetella petrii (strain ATCC BAA-461 / DSM 12804 / CCUG 43448 / CIP 107267 / Se-1111R) TaxID=340100 RepID=A9IDS3_BORPD|nr:transporter substrate-binding domain-containing protein [Bordetella petrii]CAP41603.1 ABC transporter, substrate binding protein [Bordetella petrii]